VYLASKLPFCLPQPWSLTTLTHYVLRRVVKTNNCCQVTAHTDIA